MEALLLKLMSFMFIGLLFPMTAVASPIEDASKYSVRVKSTVQYAFAEEEAGTGEGAGFLVDKGRGWVLTNAHVSGYGTGDIEVSFQGQDFVPVEAVYIDPELDLAVLKVDIEDLPELSLEAELKCSDTALNGIEVAAFGHPHGLNYSASRGIISQVRYYDGVDGDVTFKELQQMGWNGEVLYSAPVKSMFHKCYDGMKFPYFAKPLAPGQFGTKIMAQSRGAVRFLKDKPLHCFTSYGDFGWVWMNLETFDGTEVKAKPVKLQSGLPNSLIEKLHVKRKWPKEL
jgi:hypothetical protein